MKLFQQKTEIIQFDNVDTFLKEFTFESSDYIIASRSIYNAYFKEHNLPCKITFHSDYGKGEPTDTMLDAMLKDVRKANPARIIAIGGGSVMDCAKLFVFDGDDCAEDMFLQKCEYKKTRQLITIPTTCGSGSEVSRISICELTSLHTKLGLAIDELYPDQAILIPQLLSKLPFFYFVTSAIDALIHASESFLSPKSNPYTELFSKEAIHLLIHGFQNIQQYGENERLNHLETFLRASNYAGIAFGNTGTGSVHALSYPLSGVYHVTHGEANYQFFIAILKLYEKDDPNCQIKQLKNLLSNCLKCKEEEVFNSLENLLSSLLPRKPLKEYGMKEDEIKKFSESVIQSQQRLLTNSPIVMTKEFIQGIYQQLF